MATRQMIKNYEGKKKGERGSIFKYVGKTKTTYGYILELPPTPDGKRNKSEKSGFPTEFDAVLAKRKASEITSVEGIKNIEIINLSTFYEAVYKPHLISIKKLADSTLRGYDIGIQQAIEFFGDKNLIDFRKTDRVKYQNYLIDNTDFKTKTINKKIHYVKMLLDHAVYMDFISKNNFVGHNLKNVDKKEIKIFTIEQKEAIYNEIKTIKDVNKYLIPCAIADTTGARIGEVLARKWSDFDFKKKTMNIKDALTRNTDGTFSIGPTKTRKPRVVAITDDLIVLLKKHQLQQKQNKLALGRDYIDSDFVCTFENGQMVTHHTISSLSKVLKNRSIDFKFHRFRHTFATNAIKADINPKVLQEILGHSEITTTMKYYATVDSDQKVEAVENIANISHNKSFF